MKIIQKILDSARYGVNRITKVVFSFLLATIVRLHLVEQHRQR